MPFFEDIGRKISGAGQAVAQQTRNITDVAKLNNLINEREKYIAQVYSAIGQAYYERHKDDPNAEELEQIASIKQLRAEIQQFRDNINQIKGVQVCPNCGATMNIGAAFCAACGTKMPEPAPVNNGFNNGAPDNVQMNNAAPNNGVPNGVNYNPAPNNFQMNGGAPNGFQMNGNVLNNNVPNNAIPNGANYNAAPNNGAPNNNNANGAAGAQPRVCRNCGTPAADGDIFCQNCGTRLA